jgi:DNA modification methylase
MVQDKKSAANAAGTASNVVAGVAEQVKAFEAVIQYRSIDDLKSNSHNARTHSPKQIQQIAASIKEFGFVVPVLVDEEGTILAGHGRAAAGRVLGMSKVPTVCVQHLTKAQKRAFLLADNRLAELSTWDEERLAIELKELSDLDLDLPFDFEVTGFDTVDLDGLETRAAPKQPPAEVVAPVDRSADPVAKEGDLWQLGNHLLLCGNALEESSYTRLMGEQPAQMVFTDPPYNVKIDGHVCGLGAVKHQAFKMASGEMSEEEFIEFLGKAMRLMADFSIDGAIHYLCMDWRHDLELQLAAHPVYGRSKQVIAWNKTNAGMGTFYRSKHEFVFVFKVGTAPHINNFGLGERGRYRTNVWDYAGVNTFKPGRMDELTAHPTVKPLPMVVDAIRDCSTRRGVVLDPFAGSGTTILAAEKTGRIARALELDPHYVDVAIGRWQSLSGQSAIHLESGLSFNKLTAQRHDKAA